MIRISIRAWRFAPVALAVLAAAASACKEDSGIKVTSFTFVGVQAVTDGQLRSVLATTPSSKLPWGEKQYFSRDQFEADLKRIVAFYHDRGFPDAKVTSYDAKLNKDQSAVAITVTISEGEPIRVERVDAGRVRPAAAGAPAGARGEPRAQGRAAASIVPPSNRAARRRSTN